MIGSPSLDSPDLRSSTMPPDPTPPDPAPPAATATTTCAPPLKTYCRCKVARLATPPPAAPCLRPARRRSTTSAMATDSGKGMADLEFRLASPSSEGARLRRLQSGASVRNSVLIAPPPSHPAVSVPMAQIHGQLYPVSACDEI
jgi:hypothetical protein